MSDEPRLLKGYEVFLTDASVIGYPSRTVNADDYFVDGGDLDLSVRGETVAYFVAGQWWWFEVHD